MHNLLHIDFESLETLIFIGSSDGVLILKIRRFVNNGHIGSIPISGTITLKKRVFSLFLLVFRAFFIVAQSLHKIRSRCIVKKASLLTRFD